MANYNEPSYQGGYETWSGNVFGRSGANTKSAYNNYYPYSNYETGMSYRTYADWAANRGGYPTQYLGTDWKIPNTRSSGNVSGGVVGPGRQNFLSPQDLSGFMGEFNQYFPPPGGGSFTPFSFDEEPNLTTKLPPMEEYEDIPFPNRGGGGGGGAAAITKSRLDASGNVVPMGESRGWPEGGAPPAFGPPGDTGEEDDIPLPEPPKSVMLTPPAPPKTREFRTPAPFSPTQVQLERIDEGKVSAEAQRQGAPAVSKLRQALAHVATVAANEDNPAKKREMLRTAMEGAGTSLGDITLAARNAAFEKVGRDTDIQNREAEINVQSANRAAEIAYNAEMAKEGANVEAANRAAEIAYNGELTALQANAESARRSGELIYSSAVAERQQKRAIRSSEKMQERGIASNENIAARSIQAQQEMKREELAQNASLLEWSTKNANLQKKIDRIEARLLTEIGLTNQKEMLKWQAKFDIAKMNFQGKNQYDMNALNNYQSQWNIIFQTAMKQFTSGAGAGAGYRDASASVTQYG